MYEQNFVSSISWFQIFPFFCIHTNLNDKTFVFIWKATFVPAFRPPSCTIILKLNCICGARQKHLLLWLMLFSSSEVQTEFHFHAIFHNLFYVMKTGYSVYINTGILDLWYYQDYKDTVDFSCQRGRWRNFKEHFSQDFWLKFNSIYMSLVHCFSYKSICFATDTPFC